MLRRKLYVKLNRKANRLYSLVLLLMIFLFNGCTTHKGDLTFNEPDIGETFNISGKIVLTDIVETDSARLSLGKITNFSSFTVTADKVTTVADKDGYFSLRGVPFSDTLVIKAQANKIALLRRVTANELCYCDLSNLEINLTSTSEALVYQQGVLMKKDLTPADIRAREYDNAVASITTAIRLSMQLPVASINKTVLDLPAVTSAAKSVASACIARDLALQDVNSTFRHAFLRKDLEILKVYLSPSFGNDFDATSSWTEAIAYFQSLFAENDIVSLDWEILDTEFLPDSQARIKTRATIIVRHTASEEIVCNQTWTFNALWRKEGSIWKLFRNLPYRTTHLTEIE